MKIFTIVLRTAGMLQLHIAAAVYLQLVVTHTTYNTEPLGPGAHTVPSCCPAGAVRLHSRGTLASKIHAIIYRQRAHALPATRRDVVL